MGLSKTVAAAAHAQVMRNRVWETENYGSQKRELEANKGIRGKRTRKCVYLET